MHRYSVRMSVLKRKGGRARVVVERDVRAEAPSVAKSQMTKHWKSYKPRVIGVTRAFID